MGEEKLDANDHGVQDAVGPLVHGLLRHAAGGLGDAVHDNVRNLSSGFGIDVGTDEALSLEPAGGVRDEAVDVGREALVEIVDIRDFSMRARSERRLGRRSRREWYAPAPENEAPAG